MNEKNNKDDRKLSFKDLGLAAAIPQVLLKTKAQKKEEKFLLKKSHQASSKAAFDTLAKERANVERFKEMKKEEMNVQKAEKADRKQKLNIEHIKAQNKRKDVQRQREHELVVHQKELMKEKIEEKNVEDAAFKETQRMIQEDIEKRIRATRPALHVPVYREEEIQLSREKLPVLAEEQQIMEAILENNVVLISGETGSGKTTQIPQFLWEAGFGHPSLGIPFGRQGMIAVTEPRRVAAVFMAKRVAEELNEPFGGKVCYHVRYDNNLSSDCRIKFMTEGILLKELQSDFLLKKYSVVIVDEAHERSVACDVLIGLLSRVVQLRAEMAEEQAHWDGKDLEGENSDKDEISEAPNFERENNHITPLKLIIMSATLRVDDFRNNERLFPRKIPLINVEARRFPVTNHFARKTEMFKYVQESFKKVRQIHKKLPPGGILVFLSTQREIEMLTRLLRDHYRKTRILYESSRYGKHSQLHTRKEAASQVARGKRVASEENKHICKEEEDEKEEKDEFGLETKDYGLEGDEDGPSEENCDKGNSRDFIDDFDYGNVDVHDSDNEELSGEYEDVDKRIKKSLVKLREEHQQQGSLLLGSKKDRETRPEGKCAKGPGKKVPRKDKAITSTEITKTKKLFSGADERAWGAEGEDILQSELDGYDDNYDSERPDEENYNSDEEEDGSYDTMHILPLYAMLDPLQQQMVFQPPPHGKRLCVVATNVAETSITIPNIRYVVDAGRVKTKVLEDGSGASCFKIEWSSQASAEQRSGRAGRTGPGHCYRLYSTAVYSNRMLKHSTPEILRTPLESVVLMMKHLRIDNVGSFPFPTPPKPHEMDRALRHLMMIRAIDCNHKSGGDSAGIIRIRITPLGSFLMKFPLVPRLAKMIFEILRVAPENHKLHSYVTCIAAVISTATDIFALGGVDDFHSLSVERQDEIKQQQQLQKGLLHPGSDLLTALRAFGAFVARPTVSNCKRYNLVYKNMSEAQQLKRQLDIVVDEEVVAFSPIKASLSLYSEEIDANISALEDSTDTMENTNGISMKRMVIINKEIGQNRSSRNKATGYRKQQDEVRSIHNESLACRYKFTNEGGAVVEKEEEITLRKVIAVGMWDQIARRASVHEANRQGYKYNDAKTTKVPYYDIRTRNILFIHPNSSVCKTHPPPEYVCYCALVNVKRRPDDDSDVFLTNSEIMKARMATVNSSNVLDQSTPSNRIFMKCVTILTKNWLDVLGFDEDEIQET